MVKYTVMAGFNFSIEKTCKNSRARLGVIHTPHGDIHTPAFVPVGTQATVKSLTPTEIRDVGTELFFVNTYHAYLRPGLEVIKRFGGLHAFMKWDGPIITDSGGFQVFSLARPKFTPTDRSEDRPSLVKITEDGVTFQSHWDGSSHLFTPESSMEYQWILGSDIHIAFDDCTSYPITKKAAQKSMEHTHRWLERSMAAHKALKKTYEKKKLPYQALYGVVQGSVYEDLRIMSANTIATSDTDGIAIGGVSVGESKEEMANVLTWVMPHLPEKKPRHLLGVGEIDDIFVLVENGIDTFDCVQPTRVARMGRLFVSPEVKSDGKRWEIDVTKKIYEKDTNPIDATCTCMTCTHFSRAYLYHLFHVKELLAYRLATIHNLHFMHTLVASIRQALEDDTFHELKKRWIYDTV